MVGAVNSVSAEGGRGGTGWRSLLQMVRWMGRAGLADLRATLRGTLAHIVGALIGGGATTQDIVEEPEALYGVRVTFSEFGNAVA